MGPFWIHGQWLNYQVVAKYWLFDVLPIGSIYGIFTYISHRNHPDVGKYTIHGSYGLYTVYFLFVFFVCTRFSWFSWYLESGWNWGPTRKITKRAALGGVFFHGISKGYTPSKTYSLVAPCKLLVDFLFGKGLCVGVSEMATARNNSWNMVRVFTCTWWTWCSLMWRIHGLSGFPVKKIGAAGRWTLHDLTLIFEKQWIIGWSQQSFGCLLVLNSVGRTSNLVCRDYMESAGAIFPNGILPIYVVFQNV